MIEFHLITLFTICLCLNVVLVIAAGPLDCSVTACGAEKWIIQSAAYKKYFVNAKCSGGIELQNVCDKCSVECLCPSATLITPCLCNGNSNYPGKVDIDCSGQKLNDTRAAEIVSNVPATTPIGFFSFASNNLTVVPPGLPKFTTMSGLSLSSNAIPIIRQGELDLKSSTLMQLDLNSMSLQTIENNSLPRKFIPYAISLTFMSVLLLMR